MTFLDAGDGPFLLDEDAMFGAFGPPYNWKPFYAIMSLCHWTPPLLVSGLSEQLDIIGESASQSEIDTALKSLTNPEGPVVKIVGRYIFPEAKEFIRKVGLANIEHTEYIIGHKSPLRTLN